MKTITKIVSIVALGVILVQCKKRNQVSTVAYVIGDTDDIKPIDTAMSQKIPPQHLNSTVLLAVKVDAKKRKFCSGTIVEPEAPGQNFRILTNHHCFTEDQANKKEVPKELLPEHCENTRVFFGFYKDTIKERTMGECKPGTFRNDYEGDLAIFTLKENPAPKYQPAKFWDGDDIPKGRKGRIVHFPTVDSADASVRSNLVWEDAVGISLPVGQVTLDNCLTVGNFPQQEWSLDKALAMGIKHTCDQKKGSSGSSLWDVETNTILGVNWGGISLSYGSDSETHNVATRAFYVNAFLKGNLEELKGRIILATELPDQDKKMESASDNTKQALKTGCGTVGGGGNKVSSWLLFVLLLAPISIIWNTRRA